MLLWRQHSDSDMADEQLDDAERVRPIGEQEMLFCHYLLAPLKDGKLRTVAECAELAGFTPAQGAELVRRPQVVEFCREYRVEMARELARRDVGELDKYDISHVTLLRELMRMMKTPIHQTRSNMNAQVEAAKVMAVVLGPMSKVFAGRTEEELNFFADHGYFPEEKPVKGRLQ